MRKTILLISALSLTVITQAEYILNVPMDKGSIKFTNRTLPIPVEPTTPVEPPIPVEPPTPVVCSYSLNASGKLNNYWSSGINSLNNSYSIYANGVLIENGIGNNTTSTTVNGKTYTRGSTRKAWAGNFSYYEVCK